MKGDTGLEVITPMYTGIDKQSGHLTGIMVNRGRIPYEYRESAMHHTERNVKSEVEGVIFYSEGSGVTPRTPKDFKDGKVKGSEDAPTKNNSLNFYSDMK